MTQEIIEMARDSGMELYGLGKDRARFVHHLVAFAKLVAEKALAEHAMREVQRLGQEIEQEPVAWGVDWGKAGDIACVSIIKRLPNDVIELVAVEYAPYSYTAQPQRTWVGLTDEDRNDCLVEADPCECLATPEAQELMRCVEAKSRSKNT